jgi:hypothetical protein
MSSFKEGLMASFLKVLPKRSLDFQEDGEKTEESEVG